MGWDIPYITGPIPGTRVAVSIPLRHRGYMGRGGCLNKTEVLLRRKKWVMSLGRKN